MLCHCTRQSTQRALPRPYQLDLPLSCCRGHVFINRGIGGTSSSIYSVCAEHMVHQVGRSALLLTRMFALGSHNAWIALWGARCGPDALPYANVAVNNPTATTCIIAPLWPSILCTSSGRRPDCARFQRKRQEKTHLHLSLPQRLLYTHSRATPQDADLIVLEFSANDKKDAPYTDPERRGYEQLVRKLLQLPGRWASAW